MLERIQKILSARGIASRRKAEEYIEAGMVKVNRRVAKLGDKADPDTDKITVDDKVIEDRKELLYYLMWKPVGIVTSNIERWEEGKTKVLTEGQKRAMKKRQSSGRIPQALKETSTRDILPPELQGKIYPVGRLDKESGGLLLFTNDGPLAYRLTHPKFDHEKEYDVEVNNPINDKALQQMADGIVIQGVKTKATDLKRSGPSSFHIILTEGKNRQIRRMCEKLGYRVTRLTRVRIMSLTDPTMKSGDLRPLKDSERLALLKATGIS